MYAMLLMLILPLASTVASVRLKEPHLTKMCGEIRCKNYEYCSEHELICRPCVDICESQSNNYGQDLCEKDCQDYIHDVMFGYGRLREDDIDNIYVLLTSTLVLVIALLVMVGGLLFGILYRYVKQYRIRKSEDKKFQEKLSAVQYTISNNNNNTLSNNDSVRCISQPIRSAMPSTMTLTTQTESPSGTNRSSSSVTRTLPLSTEEPVEDTMMDYAAYYNQAMSHSPSHTNDIPLVSGHDSSSNYK